MSMNTQIKIEDADTNKEQDPENDQGADGDDEGEK